LRYAAQATPIPKIRSCSGRGKAKSGSNTIIWGWHHFCQHSSMAMLLIGRRLSQEEAKRLLAKFE